jgi:hypothetical protein
LFGGVILGGRDGCILEKKIYADAGPNVQCVVKNLLPVCGDMDYVLICLDDLGVELDLVYGQCMRKMVIGGVVYACELTEPYPFCGCHSCFYAQWKLGLQGTKGFTSGSA